jgi:hypothetical protein
MKRLFGKASIVMALAALLMVGGATGADAATPGGGIAVGTGTISPALTLAPQSTSVTFDGTAVGSAAGNAGTCNVHFSGNGTNETILVGNGSGTLTCGGGISAPGSISISCGVGYHRDGAVVQASGNCGAAGLLTVVCYFQATSNPPGSFFLYCEFVLL